MIPEKQLRSCCNSEHVYHIAENQYKDKTLLMQLDFSKGADHTQALLK